MKGEDRPGGDAGTALKSTVRTAPSVTGTDAEVVTPMDRAAAERLDKRIRLMGTTMRDHLVKIEALLIEAKAGQIHLTLGHKSWTAYLADVLGGRLEMNTETRRAVVELLAGEGMSQRGIAKAVSVSQSTVRDDLNELSSNYSPEDAGSDHVADRQPATVTSLNGRVHPRHKAATPPVSATGSNRVPVQLPIRVIRRIEKRQRRMLEKWEVYWNVTPQCMQEFGTTLAGWMTPHEAKEALRGADKYLTELNRIRKLLRERADHRADHLETQ
jgi:hypothetical protein